MRKFLSLLLIPAFTLLFFFSIHPPAEAACSFEITTPTPISTGSPITVSITGENGQYFTALIVKSNGDLTPFIDSTLIENGNRGEITLTTPNEAGDYMIGVWRGPPSNVLEECGRKSFTLVTNPSTCEGFIGCLSSVHVPGLRFSNQSTFIGQLISNILPIVLGLGGFISVIIIVISGIQFITSSGNPEAAAAARNRLIFALVGLAIIILAFAITQIVARIFLGETEVL